MKHSNKRVNRDRIFEHMNAAYSVHDGEKKISGRTLTEGSAPLKIADFNDRQLNVSVN